jgi:replicative DNA helicase
MNYEHPNQPHSVEAERRLLATCIDDGIREENTVLLDDVSAIVEAEDFYVYKHKLLFEALQSLANDSQPLNEVSIHERLKTSGATDEVGGLPGLLNIMDEVSTGLQARFFAKTVAEKSRLRALMRSCRTAAEQAEKETTGYDEIRAELEADITAKPKLGIDTAKISTSTEELKKEIQLMKDGEFTPDVIRTHIGRLDWFLGNGGIAAGEVLTLAAPTSCGKSAWALFVALNAVKKEEKATAIFSLEMPQKQLTKRMTQIVSGVNLRNVQDRNVTDIESKRVDDAIDELGEMPIYSSHSVKSADDLISQARSFVNNNGVKLVIVDYLQLIPFNSNKMGKTEGIANISHKIKQMALDLNVAVILLAQVNREGAKRGGLELYDLKDSGDIENDADVVLLMWPSNGDVESSKDSDHSGHYTNLLYKLAKNREGERGIGCFFKFYHGTGRFK